MTKVTDLITKFEKLATEAKAPAHGKHTVSAESAQPKASEKAEVPETLVIGRSAAKGSEKAMPSKREQEVLDVLEHKAQIEQILGDPQAENPILKALQVHLPKQVFDSFKTMMGTLNPAALRNINQSLFGPQVQAFYGKDMDYQNISTRQLRNIEIFKDLSLANIREEAEAVLNTIVARGGGEIDQIKENLSFNHFTNEVDFHCHIIEFNRAAGAEGQDILQAYQNYTACRQIINESAENNIPELSLDDKDLIVLPPEIEKLKQLQTLWLAGNKLTTLPPEFGQLKQLQILSVERNKLTSLPPEIGQLEQLQSLNLAVNRLTTLPPEFVQLRQLVEFTPDANQLTSLPPGFGQLKQLQVLNLGQNQLTSLPAEIGQLEQLERLHVRHNPLTSIPHEFVELKKLQVLSVPNLPDFQGIINELKANNGDKLQIFVVN